MALRHVGGHGVALPLEMAEAVLEVADLAWSVYEHRSERAQPKEGRSPEKEEEDSPEDDMLKLRSENLRLRGLLKENLAVMHGLANSPGLSQDCPADIHDRLVAVVKSADFLAQLEELQKDSKDSSTSPFKEIKGTNLKSVDILVYDDHGKSSLWVWVNDFDSETREEPSEIDDENYVIICEDDVVDGIASFIAKCVVMNPKSMKLAPEELQKTISRALGGMKDRTFWKNVWFAGKLFYALSTWGIALAGLYRHRTIVKAAAKGALSSGKFVMKAF